MLRLKLAMGAFALVLAVPYAHAAAGAADLTRPEALALVRAVVLANRADCGLRIVRIDGRRVGKAWRVAAVTAGRARGTSRWTVLRAARPANALARRIAAGCPPARPTPPPPPAQPPPPAPVPVGAAFVAGAGVPPEQLDSIRSAIGVANGYFRARLGRELSAAFTVYVYGDLEGIAAAYAQATGNSLDRSRELWQAGTTAVAQSRGMFVYLGSQSWAQSRDAIRAKIVAHEAFHLLQGELAGPAALNSGRSDVPVAGPRWLTEGAAEYIAYRVLAENRLEDFDAIRRRWISVTRSVTAPLSSLEIATGFGGVAGIYDLTPLAASRLIETAGEGAFVAYWEAIGRGTPWQSAFAAAFGRSLEAFYGEFDAYRRGL